MSGGTRKDQRPGLALEFLGSRPTGYYAKSTLPQGVSRVSRNRTTAWHMLSNGEFYREPGLDYYTRRVPAKTKARALKQLESLGYRVTLEPLADTA